MSLLLFVLPLIFQKWLTETFRLKDNWRTTHEHRFGYKTLSVFSNLDSQFHYFPEKGLALPAKGPLVIYLFSYFNYKLFSIQNDFAFLKINLW
jgi:hypothetical protein